MLKGDILFTDFVKSNLDFTNEEVEEHLQTEFGCNILDELNIEEFLPGLKSLLYFNDIRGVYYHCGNCTAKVIDIYELSDYYIVYKYNNKVDTEGDAGEKKGEGDIMIFNPGEEYRDDEDNCTMEFFNNYIIVIKKENFSCEDLLNEFEIINLEFIMELYKIIYNEKGLEYYLKFLVQYYNKHLLDIAKDKPKTIYG